MAMSYRETKGKVVICKDGIYMSFTDDQLKELKLLLADIESGKKEFYKENARRG